MFVSALFFKLFVFTYHYCNDFCVSLCLLVLVCIFVVPCVCFSFLIKPLHKPICACVDCPVNVHVCVHELCKVGQTKHALVGDLPPSPTFIREVRT